MTPCPTCGASRVEPEQTTRTKRITAVVELSMQGLAPRAVGERLGLNYGQVLRDLDTVTARRIRWERLLEVHV